MKAAILGTTGYTGMVLLRLLARHPRITEIIPASSSQAGTPLSDFDRGLSSSILDKIPGGKLTGIEDALHAKPEVVFAALPHLTSAEVCGPFFGQAVVIDLSADFRIKDARLFAKAYGQEPKRQDLLAKAAYGLAEWYRGEIAAADLIANPGCYPTATLLPLLPLYKAGLVKGTAVVNALSGVSGAGRGAKINTLFCERAENANAYSPGTSHRHASEILHILAREAGGGPEPRLLFTPHLVPLKQGMAVTSVVELAGPAGPGEIAEALGRAYAGCPFVELKGRTIPETRDVRWSNRIDLGWQVEGDRLMLFSVIDNLLKGASGQAVQNMNIRFGFDESEGLSRHGEF